MFPQKTQNIRLADSKTYPLGEKSEPATSPALALVALSHTSVEQRLYAAMLIAAEGNGQSPQPLTARQLIGMSGIRSLSTVRRGLEGLISKLSIERVRRVNGNPARETAVRYRVYLPEEVIGRRNERGLQSVGSRTISFSFERAINRVVEQESLSRREAQVALCCVEGLTNAQIGSRLNVSEQTVKFHLRHVFIKFGVKRRAELISRLLM